MRDWRFWARCLECSDFTNKVILLYRKRRYTATEFCGYISCSLFLQKLADIQFLSISPDSFQIVEKTVFFVKYMNDHIAVIHKYPAGIAGSLNLFWPQIRLCPESHLHYLPLPVLDSGWKHWQLQNNLRSQILHGYQSP